MLNDPLLPPPPPPVTKSTMKTASPNKQKVKKPARSAKILVTGLSATAVLGMASGYALAGKAPAKQVSNGVTAEQQTQLTLPSVDPAITPNTVTSNNNSAPQVTTPPVVQVPVPQATPATPGTSNSGWQQQQSSGSR